MSSNLDTILPLLEAARRNKKIIVLVTGVFDVLHQEHLVFIKKAKQSGDFLLVGVETDDRVTKMKGSGRPINPQADRLKSVGILPGVNLVFLLPSQFDKPEDHRQLIGLLKPDIIAISSHTKFQEEKRSIVEKFGGKLKIVHTHNPDTSTTQIINNKS